MHTRLDNTPFKVGLLVYPGCVVSGLFAFAELLDAANRRAGGPVFKMAWTGLDDGPVPAAAGMGAPTFSVPVNTTLQDPKLDVVLVPGFWTSSVQEVSSALRQLRPLVESLRTLNASTEVWGYCTAACLLAEAGLLEDQVATSTWWLAEHLRARHPNVRWNFRRTSVNGEGQATASGVNGYLPMALSLIEQRCGREVLRDIVDTMVVPRPEAMQQPFAELSLMRLEDSVLRRAIVWIEDKDAAALSVAALAHALHLTERTLARRVRASTPYSCAQFMRFIKMRQAGDRLIHGRETVYAISDALGFSDDAAFRRGFKKVSSYTPSEFRRTFRR